MGKKGRRYFWLMGFAFLILLAIPLASFAEIPAQIRYMIAERNVSGLTRQLDQGFDVNSRDENGETLLIIAAKKNRPEMVKVLMDKGADVNAADNNGKTALDYAKEHGFSEIITLLGGK